MTGRLSVPPLIRLVFGRATWAGGGCARRGRYSRRWCSSSPWYVTGDRISDVCISDDHISDADVRLGDRDRIGDVCISDDHISDADVRLGDRDRIGDVWRWLAATPMAMTT